MLPQTLEHSMPDTAACQNVGSDYEVPRHGHRAGRFPEVSQQRGNQALSGGIPPTFRSLFPYSTAIGGQKRQKRNRIFQCQRPNPFPLDD